MHAYPYITFSLALGATPTVLVEGEEGRGVAVYLGILLLRQELANVIVDLQIGHGIGAGTLSYRILVDILDVIYTVEIARESAEDSWQVSGFGKMTAESRVEDVSDQRRLSGAAYPSNDGEDS